MHIYSIAGYAYLYIYVVAGMQRIRCLESKRYFKYRYFVYIPSPSNLTHIVLFLWPIKKIVQKVTYFIAFYGNYSTKIFNIVLLLKKINAYKIE